MKPEDKEYFDSVRSYIDENNYFEEGRKWYATKYLYVVTERSFFIVLTTISLITFFFAVRLLTDFLPLTITVPVAVNISDTTKEYATIKQIGSSEEEPNIALARYLVNLYIRMQERYNNKSPETRNLDANLQLVKQFSSQEVLGNFQEKMSRFNPNSPTLRYRKHTTRTIEPIEGSFRYSIKKDFPEAVEAIYDATILFDATEESDRFVEPRTTRYIASIKFRYSDIQFDKEKHEFKPLDFEVLNYEIRKY